jgi:hypothetical protein
MDEKIARLRLAEIATNQKDLNLNGNVVIFTCEP